MIRNLNFLTGFRPKKGCSAEIKDLRTDNLDNKALLQGGVYIICSEKEKFVYPKGLSKVMYIGKADELYQRLKNHQKQCWKAADIFNKVTTDWVYDRYNYMHVFGARVYIYCNLGKQEAKELEAKCISDFYDKFGAKPICNGAWSFTNRV